MKRTNDKVITLPHPPEAEAMVEHRDQGETVTVEVTSMVVLPGGYIMAEGFIRVAKPSTTPAAAPAPAAEMEVR